VVHVKICGVTRLDEALACASAGADWIGLNFHSGSPRFISEVEAARIVDALPPSVSPVGIFVDRAPREVTAVAARIGLKIVQLHGNEPPEDLPELERLEVVKAFSLKHADAWEAVNRYLDRAKGLGRSPDAVLIDSHRSGKAGGTGVTIADSVLDRIPPLPRLILAGGLTPRNVAERAARVQPWMVDVASGVESAPGRKDLALVAAFVAAIRTIPRAGSDLPLGSDS
jgi:phosphoribosylanthranilate isomerase